MANPVIQAGGVFSKHFMEVSFLHLRLSDPAGQHPDNWQVSYREVDCVLLSPANQLTMQIGKRLFSIPVKPDNPAHREALDALSAALARSDA